MRSVYKNDLRIMLGQNLVVYIKTNVPEISGSSLTLTRGEGSVCVLEKYTWFGEDEE